MGLRTEKIAGKLPMKSNADSGYFYTTEGDGPVGINAAQMQTTVYPPGAATQGRQSGTGGMAFGSPLATKPDVGTVRRRRARLANLRPRMSDSTG